MKITVRIPQGLLEHADRVARQLDVSRSELVTRALRDLLGAERSGQVTESYDDAFADPLESPIDVVRNETARRTLLDVAW